MREEEDLFESLSFKNRQITDYLGERNILPRFFLHKGAQGKPISKPESIGFV